MRFILGSGSEYCKIEPCETNITNSDLYEQLVNHVKMNYHNSYTNELYRHGHRIPYKLCYSLEYDLTDSTTGKPFDLDGEIDWDCDVLIAFKETYCVYVITKRNNGYYRDINKNNVIESYIYELKYHINRFRDNIAYINKSLLKPEFHHKLQEICDEIVEKKPEAIKFIDRYFKTQKMCCDVFAKNNSLISEIPSEFINDYMCKRLVMNRMAIDKIPEEKKTQELCLLAVKYGYMDFIPEKQKTPELYLFSLEINTSNVKFIPTQFYECGEFCKKAFQLLNININLGRRYDLLYIPYTTHTKELFINIFRKKQEDIELIINNYILCDNFKNEEFMLLLVSNNPLSILYIDSKYQTVKVLDALFIILNDKQHERYIYNILTKINYNITTPEMCNNIFKFDTRLFQNIPDNNKTQEMSNKAFESNHRLFRYIPDKYKTPYMCFIVVEWYDEFFQYVPIELRTYELSLKVIEFTLKKLTSQSQSPLQHIPDQHIKQFYKSIQNNYTNLRR
jgi:hypothetical protein